MASKIRVLTEHTINKIAAGEVIENPASVVKELVENSIDAGSTEITVEIKGGGRQLIRISDNGCGMNADDALLCLERHATSKLKEIEDIHSLHTMGFRGEAIPSIASISKLTILTRPQNSTEGDETPGTMVMVDGGKLIKTCPVECAAGTTIEVKSLFFNVPARKKFQKSPVHDTLDIQKMLTSLALANPQTSFRLISNQETLFTSGVPQGEDFLAWLGERVQDILGGEFFQTSCPVQGSKGDLQLYGWIGLPAHTRHNRTGQFTFINQRGIFSPLVSYAVREGYGTTLSTNRHPVFVLHLMIPGSLVDVNVHPQKREVRLRQEQTLKELIRYSIEEALQKAGFLQISAAGALSEQPFEPAPRFAPEPAVFPKFSFMSFTQEKAGEEPPPFFLKGQAPPLSKTQPLAPLKEPELFPSASPQRQTPKVLGTIQNYIIVEPTLMNGQHGRAGLCLLDQRAAHARIIFEKLCKSISFQALEQQFLLIPYTMEMTPPEAGVISQHLTALQQMGIQIKEFGKNTFTIDALPHVFGDTEVEALVHEIAKNLQEQEGSQAVEKELARKVAAAASRSAVSSQTRLTLEEAQALVKQLVECGSPTHCPAGRPIMAILSYGEIAKYFK